MALYGWQEPLGGMDAVANCYVLGYKHSADILVEQAHDFGGLDILLFPIIFSYRQYIELSLKYIGFINFEKQNFVKMMNDCSHDLKKIWDFLEDESVLVTLNAVDKNFIYNVVSFFDEIDKKSMTFRYFVDKSANNSIDIKSEIRYNLQELKNIIDEFDTIIKDFVSNTTGDLYL